MKVKGIQKQKVEVDVSINNVIKSLKNHFYEKYDPPPTSYIENGVWIEEIWAHTTHTFRMDEKVRAATKEELKVDKALNTLQKAFRKSI